MRRLIRNRNKVYLKANGAWTDNWQEAEGFRGVREAIFALRRLCSKDAELVLMPLGYPDPTYDVVLPLSRNRSAMR
jgi:hypothetical protein